MESKRHADAQVTFISLLLSALFGWIAFAVDIALAIIARNRLRRAYDIGGSLGNGIWLALGGAVRIYPAKPSQRHGSGGRKCKLITIDRANSGDLRGRVRHLWPVLELEQAREGQLLIGDYTFATSATLLVWLNDI